MPNDETPEITYHDLRKDIEKVHANLPTQTNTAGYDMAKMVVSAGDTVKDADGDVDYKLLANEANNAEFEKAVATHLGTVPKGWKAGLGAYTAATPVLKAIADLRLKGDFAEIGRVVSYSPATTIQRVEKAAKEYIQSAISGLAGSAKDSLKMPDSVSHRQIINSADEISDRLEKANLGDRTSVADLIDRRE